MSSNGELRWTAVLIKEFSACPSPDGWSNNRLVCSYSSMASFQGQGEGAAFVPGLGCCINPQRFSDGLNQGAHVPFFGKFADGAVLLSGVLHISLFVVVSPGQEVVNGRSYLNGQ